MKFETETRPCACYLQVSLYDRSLMPGDAVRRNQEGSQRGIVRSVHVSCHLQVVRTKQMIYDVSSQDLEHIMVSSISPVSFKGNPKLGI